MSRTYRHRHDLRGDWTGRDGGNLAYKGRAAFHGDDVPWGSLIHAVWSRFWKRDKKDDRLNHQRAYRRTTRLAVRKGDYDNIRQWSKTSGWLTW
jgi:hypothetical protein